MVTETQRDWGNEDRWLIDTMGRGKSRTWRIYRSNKCGNSMDPLSQHPTFAEAHAAYLDAVTCESTYDATDVPSVAGVVRCIKARGHKDRWHECSTGGWTRDNSGAVFVG